MVIVVYIVLLLFSSYLIISFDMINTKIYSILKKMEYNYKSFPNKWFYDIVYPHCLVIMME